MAQCTVIFCWLVLLFLLATTGHSQRISWVTPTRASIAGGTTLKIYGSGFTTDAYASSNLVYLGNIPCQVNWYTVTVSSLECVTVPYPDAQEGNSSGSLRIQLISNGVHFVSYYRFIYYWNYTPQVRAVVPSSGPLGSVIEIGGYRFQGSLNSYERFFLGSSICDPRAPGTNAQYGIRRVWHLHYAKCIITEQQVGGWNASAILTAGYRGASWNHSEALYPMHDWKLAMYELFPDIHSIFPQSGSDQGGTLLTIQGTGFGINADHISVDVDSIPCQIVSHSTDKIQCWTGRPPAGSPAVASDNNGYPITNHGYRFRGSRGVRLHQWRNIGGGRLSNLHSSSHYPDNPNRYGIRPSFSTKDTRTRDSYGERLMAFFNPHASGSHTFFLSSDDEGGLWVAHGNNITNIDKIASNPYPSGWNNFARYPSQRSEVFNLTEGEDYLLVGEFKEGSGGDYIQVGVLMHEETSFTYAQTQKVNRERQLLRLTTEGLYDIQVLQVAVNKSDIDNNNPPEFFVNWGGRTSNILPVLDLETNPDLLDNTVISLFNGVCDFGRELGVRHYDDVFDFEGGVGSAETWRAWNGITPEIVEDESFCGRHSLYVEESRAIAFTLAAEEGFRTSDYPFLCLAYKLPPNHPMGIAINVPGIGWRTIQVSSTGRFPITVIGSFADHTADRLVYDDDRWHYQCVDLQSLLRQELAAPSDDSTPEYRITGFGFYSDPDPERRGFHVDEVSFSSEDREVRLNMERYLSPARPNGIALHNIIKMRQLHLTGDDTNIFNLTIAMEIIPASCDYDIPLMNITLVNESTPGVLEFSVDRIQSASVPLRGSYTLSYGGATSAAIPHNAEKDKIEEALEALPGVGDVTAWYHSTPLLQDQLGKFCPGWRAFIQFETTPGDLPLLDVGSGNLTGDGLEASIREDVTGGLFLRPIPGHMLQTVETTPQVHVRVKGQLAACSGGHSLYAELTADSHQDVCGFTYSPSLAPNVSYISPTNATNGDVIQIHGHGFSSDVTENFVLFGGISCVVTSSSSVMIECTLGQGTAGTKPLYLHVLSTGVAESEGIELWYQVEIHSISVTEGSDAGGTEIVIMGTGFVPQFESNDSIPADTNPALDYANTLVDSGCSSWERNVVLIGDNECTIFDSTHTSISCITPENTGLGTTYNVMVTILCEDNPADMSYTGTLTNGYTYNAALTPSVTSVTPNQGSVFGEEEVTISGSGFSEILEENHVMIGSAACRVTSSTSTQIKCVTPPHGRGSANVVVRVAGKGRASGDFSFMFLTEVTSLSHCSGSIFGGQVLAIDGIGFGNDSSHLEVSLGDHPCQLVSVSDTRVICITGSTTQTHHINNNARHENYGLGYRWSPDSLTIHVGDTVEWAWTRSSFTTQTNVAQVEWPGDTEYNGYGFRSQPSITGRFSHSFTTPGTFYYIAEGYGHIGFGGEITVQDLETQNVPLHVTINSILLDLSDLNISCGDTGGPFTNYTYSVADTPVVSIIMGSSLSEADNVLLNLQHISILREDNVLTFGGLPCAGDNALSVVSNQSEPDLSSPRTTMTHSLEDIQCTVPFLEPGHHRIVLHVAGKGWARASLDTTTLHVRAVVDSTPNQATGSLRGGIKVSIPIRGLTMSDIPRSRVSIGDTPCHIQMISDYGDLICIPQPAINDGYSSVVYHDQAVAYWSLQADYFEPNGTYIDSDSDFFYRSGGTLGRGANATVFGEVVPRQVGISGNSLTDQSVLFNASYIEAPALSEFSHPAGFGIGLWVKTPDNRAHYRIMTNSASFESEISRGFLLLLNPCNELESWVAVGEPLSEFSSSVSCQLIVDQSNCSQPCTGYITVSESTIPGSLPAGVWHVIRSVQSDWSDWHFVSFGWEADDDSLVQSWRADSDNCTANSLCSGTHVLHIDSSLVSSSTTTYLHSPHSTIQLGGTSQLELGITTVDNSSQLAPFAGYLDEISFYRSPLSSIQVESHYYYGSSEKQPIWIVTDAVDGVGTGVVPNVVYPERDPGFEEETMIDWDVVRESTYTIGNATAIQFQWNGLHGVRQVTRSVYESCDLQASYIRQWAPNQRGGDVTVWVDNGGVYYFIDSVVGGCLEGTKIKVTVGEMVVIDWRLTTYSDLTITEGMGLLFQWAGPVQHNVIEMASPLSVTQDCKFVNLDSKKLGQAVREWHATPTTNGEVAVIGLSVGRHHFVCSVPGHCQYGMRFTVTVTRDTVTEEEEEDLSPVVHTIPWRIQRYEPLTITRGETVRFVWEGFHSLHQLTKEAFDSCDLSVAPLYEWGEPSVDNSVSISSLSPGAYYFICAVSGHCDAGMKIQVNVLPANGLPVISDPVVAECRDSDTRQCSFAYSRAATPELLRVEPDHSHAGTTLRVYGQGLVDPHAAIGIETEDTVVWIGDAPCSNVTIVNSSTTEDILECIVADYESHFYPVDVFVEGKGFASVGSNPFGPGPLRNATYPVNQLSPYPIFFLAATATTITPNNGSLAGGTHVLISGSGFSLVSERVSVMLGSIPCQIVSSSISEISCITGPSLAASQEEVALSVRVNGFPASTSLRYTYTSVATPTITAVSEGSNLIGGDLIQISGQNFANDMSLLQVQITPLGDNFDFSVSDSSRLCTITAASETSIACTVPSMAAGSHQVLVHVRRLGLAKPQGNVAMVTYTLEIEDFSPSSAGNGGGVQLTLFGSGFPTVSLGNSGANVIVRVCQATCNVTESSVSQLNCTLGANNIASPFTTSTSCNVSITYRNIVANSTTAFNFIGIFTPRLDSISPTIGGTAGGTIVTVSGSGFFPPGVLDASSLPEQDILVTIDGSVCEWFGRGTTLTATTIICRTSEHRTTLQAEVKVFVQGKGNALNGNGPVLYEYIDRWSSVYTWGGGPLPQLGDSVYIKQGQTVFLDISPPVLNLILIEGALIFEDEQDLHLQAKYIFINHGKLQVGTEASPFQHMATITLHGSVTDPEIPIYGAKVIGIRQGELDLHGRPRNITWVRLAETANTSDTSLHVQQPVDWVPGDRIVIAPTGKDGNETEEAMIDSVSDDGTQINLVAPLNYTHHGVREVFEDGQFIEMRAEAGLLSHNVVVEGTRLENLTGFEGLGADKYGVQIFVHRMGPHPTPIRIEHTEVRNAGQAFRLGRYAIHFHLSGSMNGSYVRHCAIHHSFNRAITAHGVHNLLIGGNVAYDIMGHTYFVEDGIETYNRYLGNLGVLTRGSSSLLNTDQIPATFWITNPLNTFVGNVAAASRAYGFWYDLDNNPSGASFTRRVCPNKTPFGEFRDNVAHTCNEFGLRIWERYTPYADACAARQPSVATLYNFTSYSNGIHGLEFSVVGHVRIVGFKVADNVVNGIEIQETLGSWGGPMIQDTLVISHTSINTGEPQLGGIKTPNTPKLTVSNVTFVNFDLPRTSCLRACSHCKVRQGGFQVWFEGLSFLGGSQNRKMFFQWEHEVLYYDLDGTLTGSVGGWATPNSELHPPQHCTKSVPEFSLNPAQPGTVCTSNVHFLRMAWNQATPLATLRDVNVNVSNEFGFSLVPWRHYRLTHMDGYMLTMPSGYEHTLNWTLRPQHRVDTTFYRAGVYGLLADDRLWITHEFVMLPDHVNVGGNYEPTVHGSVPTPYDPHLSWHINNETNTVTYLISGVNRTGYNDVFLHYSYEPCPRDGCPPPGIDFGPYESFQRRWSDPGSWPSGALPEEGEDVIISSRWRMLMDVTPPPLREVFVLGELMFEDLRDYNFTANLILIQGPNARLIIGTETSPFTHHVVLTLTGRRSNDDLPLTRTLNLGSKAIGVFGNLSIHGVPKTRTWTRLASSARAGEDQIVLQGDNYPDWQVGEEVVIAASRWDPEEAEIRTISNYDVNSGTITLDTPLQFDHIVHRFLDPSDINSAPHSSHWWGDGGSLAPEVGLLTHNIVIQGGEDSDEPLEFNHYGCRLLAGSYSTSWFTFTGHLKLDSVEIRYCGQGGYFSPRDPRYAIAFRDSFNRSGGSYIRRCSIHHGYNTAIGVHTTDGVEISHNVIWRTTDSSIKVGGRNNTITDNLAMMTTTIQPNNPRDNHAVDFPATFDVDGGNTVRGNAAAGSTRIAFRFSGEPCLENNQPPTYEEANFWDNTAHTGLLGLSVLGLPSSCTSIGGFSTMFQWNYGVFSSTASSLVATHLKIAAGKVGLNLNVFGPNPVEHFLGRKSITIADSLIVGSLPGESCQARAPNYRMRGSVTIAPENHTLGIMMSSFNQRRSKMDGTGAWHLMKGYPVIDGVVHAVNLSFARFFDLGCDYGIFAIGNNPLSPDAVHPMHMRGTAKFNVNLTSLAFFYEPDVEWIVQEDCVDMDCDGPKHALIRDIDGRFVDSYPAEGSIIPFAELRFGDYSNRLPVTWLASTEFGERARADQVVEHMGIARGETGNLDNPNGGCVFMPQWQAYSCKNLQHHMFVIESMDADTETRRLSPIALDGGNTGNGDYTDLLNGPMDHGWCTYYTCLKRLSTFFSLVAVGTDYCVWMTGSSPSHLRFHLLNAGQNDVIKLCVWFKTTLRKDVYKNGIFIEPENVVYLDGGGVEQLDDSRHIPSKETSFGGANYFDRASQIMHVVIKGSDPIEIRTPPVVQVSLNLAVSIDDFFNVGELINNLAFVLRINPSSIRVVNIIAEDQPTRSRRSLLAVTETNQTTITLEFGDPPPLNVSTPEAPSVAQEINMAGETNDSVDLEGNMLPEAPAMGTNPLNEDPPSSIEQFAGDFNVSVSQYNVNVEAYQQALSEVEEVNELGDQIVNLILINGTSVIENATITGFSVVAAALPIAPSPPFIPPEFENATINGEPAVTPVEEITTPRPPPGGDPSTGEGESLQYTIPAAMRVTMEPQEETGHLVHVAVTVFDTTGQPVPNLGLVHPWMCEATLLHNHRNQESAPQLGGQTSVPFVGGVAEFTRLRVDRASQLLTLKFSTNPSRFVAQTSVQFDVITPPENTQRERVVFVLAGSTGALPGNEAEIEEAVRLALWRQLDIDVSRIQDITITVSGDGEMTVEVDLLERYPTDPPNVPALRESITQLQMLINSQQLVALAQLPVACSTILQAMGSWARAWELVTIDGEHLTAVSGSFGYPTLPSPSSPSPVPLDLTTIIIIVCSSVGGVLCVAAACVFAYYCTGQCGRRKKGKASGQKQRVKKVERHFEEDDSSSDDSDIYLERTTHPPSPSHLHIPTNLPHPHVPLSAESPSDSGMETDRDSIVTSAKMASECLYSNQYADCWSDTLPSSHRPPLHSKHKPTVTLSGLANPGYGLPPPPLWSPPPPPVSVLPPDWTQDDRAHNMATKRQ